MNQDSIYEIERNAWASKRKGMTKGRFESASGRTPFGERLSIPYLRKGRFLQESMLVFGLVMKEILPVGDAYPTIHDFALYSLERDLSENPAVLKEISRKIRDLQPKTKQEKQIKALYESREPFSGRIRLPSPLCEGHEIYLCCVSREPGGIEGFHLGTNPILVHPGRLAESYFLPDAFWGEQYAASYRGEKEN